jgi:hypothetical protein
MRLLALVISTGLLAACTPQDLAVNSTSKVLVAGQPSLQQEADYELARSAIPGALKTVESFWISGFGNSGAHTRLERILMEGFCQYGTGFVEDDWEEAKFRKDLAAVEYHNARSSHIFTRCLNYALRQLGSGWQKDLFGTTEQASKRIAGTVGLMAVPALAYFVDYPGVKIFGVLLLLTMTALKIIRFEGFSPERTRPPR